MVAQNTALRLFENRFHSKKAIDSLLKPKKKRKSAPRIVTGIQNGNYFRLVKSQHKRFLPDIPKLPSPQKAPIGFKNVSEESRTKLQNTIESPWKRVGATAWAWLRENSAVLVFNMGSICTLIGFTRSDVLELRVFSATGSVTGVLYHLVQKPLRWPPLLWGMTFAMVNAYKIYEILSERHTSVRLSLDDEDWYVTHFLSHGLTPRQYEVVRQSAKERRFRKGEIMVRQGERLDHLYLVVQGTTRASALGRFVTAASMTPSSHKRKLGGASGAWIGEMAFLETFGLKEQGFRTTSVKTVPCTKEETTPKKVVRDQTALVNRRLTGRALYTIVATEDCKVLEWDHTKMEELMCRSTDMRAALTRAMTAAIVGKVINFTVSRVNKPSWADWLGDWKNNSGASIEISEPQPEAAPAGDSTNEKIPSYPIKKFE